MVLRVETDRGFSSWDIEVSAGLALKVVDSLFSVIGGLAIDIQADDFLMSKEVRRSSDADWLVHLLHSIYRKPDINY